MAPPVEPVTTPISPAKTCDPRGARSLGRLGFTLIEIMIVLGIIAAAMTIAIPRLFGKRDNDIKATARHFMVLGKEVRNRARLKNVPLRLVIDMDPAAPKYWVEIASGPQLIDPDADREEEKKKDDEEEKPEAWSIDKVLTKDKKELPGKLYFAQVETINMQAPQTEGIAYIHFFPEGLMEAAALQITDRQRMTWTLIFNPLTGQADIIDQARGLRETNR